MGRIASSDGREWTLGSIHIIGGDAGADTTLHHASVSIPHVRLSWDGSGWQIRDLGSANGTWVSGEPLVVGRDQPIDLGESIRFGEDGPVLVLTNADRPVAMLVDPRTGEEHLGTSSWLAWPNGEDPELVIAQNVDEEWNAEWPSPGHVDPVIDREQLRVGARTWVVRLPRRVRQTLGRVAFRPDLRFATLEFRVPCYQEDIELRVIQGSAVTRVGAHAHNYMLYQLALFRERDVERGFSAEAAGWVGQEELLRIIDYTAPNFYVEVHRARTRLENAGVEQAACIIERRRGSRQVRLGVPSFRIVKV